MVAQSMVELLEPFLSGRIDAKEFEQRLSDTLFQLRQDPVLTEEKKLLVKIQLYLHEFREGNRDLLEVYIAAQAALDIAKPSSAPVTSQTETHIPPIGRVSTASSGRPPSRAKLRELQLV